MIKWISNLDSEAICPLAGTLWDEWDLCKNHQPLVLVGRGFGTLVLDNLFLKATEELLTSPTEAGAFVRNVRGVTLYGDNAKSYKIEKKFEGKLKEYKPVIDSPGLHHRGLHHRVFITHGSMLIDPTIYGKNLTRDVRLYSTHTSLENSCGLMCP
jgi:hypothetical protein